MSELDITVKIGGEAGHGIQTIGNMLALACCKAGFYCFGINDFESRIRGGHSFFQLRITGKELYAPHHTVNMLVAMDRNTVSLHKDQVLPEGIIIINDSNEIRENNIISIPIVDIAQKAGGTILASTVVIGIILGLLGIPSNLLEKVIRHYFENLDEEKLKSNIMAGKLGFRSIEDIKYVYAIDWATKGPERKLISGSMAIALGALAGDCRFASFYPMSPATSIMEHLASYQDKFPLVVEQAEDEIAAVNMIMGSAFAGVRSITATAGGGFCLMTEGLGLSGITETPIVIINAQRPGPATGLPTRTAQGDLHFVIRAAQDDFPRFVFASGSPKEAYEITNRALNISEKYQTPVIILADQFLNDSLFDTDGNFPIPDKIERFISDVNSDKKNDGYKRYALTKSGVSPRIIPGMSEELILVSGNEHSEDGHISESIEDRNNMVEKRARKIEGMLSEMRGPELYRENVEILLIGWGSTQGILKEAADLLQEDGINAGSVHFCDIWPFPAKAAHDALCKANKLFSIEQNSTGQFAQLLRQEIGIKVTDNILKYDGRPFYPSEIYKEIIKKIKPI